MVDMEAIKKETWARGRLIEGIDPGLFRKDEYGNWLKYDQFLTDNFMSWDLEKRNDRDGTGMSFYPVSRERVKRIFHDVEKAVSELAEAKRREMEGR